MKPIVRSIVSIVLLAGALAPIIVSATGWELSRSRVTEAEKLRNHRLRAIANEKLARNCYRAIKPLTKGEPFEPGGLAKSLCVTHDGTEYGFLETHQGITRIVDVYSGDSVSKVATTLVNPKKK